MIRPHLAVTRPLLSPCRRSAVGCFQPLDVVSAVCEITSDAGAFGPLAFGFAHVLAIVVAFPATILFELAAGVVYGFYEGSALAWAAKVSAALITYALASGAARGALAKAGVPQAASAAFAARPELARLVEGIEREGMRFTVLARLSPIPSYLNNYGLALAGVRLTDYAVATAVASLPPVLTHVYTGTLLASLASIEDGVPPSLASSALGALTIGSAALLVRQALVTVSSTGGGVDEAAERADEGGATSAEAATEQPGEAGHSRKDGRTSGDVRCCAPPRGDDGAVSESGGGEEGDTDGERRVMLAAWQAVRELAPPLLTGASGAHDGDGDPAAALFNMLLIRLPFLFGLLALAANLLLGGGVAVGDWAWPPPSPSDYGVGGLDAIRRLRGGGAICGCGWLVVSAERLPPVASPCRARTRLGPPPEAKPPPPGAFHPGIVCAVTQRLIVGYRYTRPATAADQQAAANAGYSPMDQYSLCQTAFDALPPAEQTTFKRIDPPADPAKLAALAFASALLLGALAGVLSTGRLLDGTANGAPPLDELADYAEVPHLGRAR